MKNVGLALVSSLLASVPLFGQHTVVNCGLPNNPNPDCYLQESGSIGRLRFEDYKVTNPLAVQFDPAQRAKELAALDPANVDLMCRASANAYTLPAPSITFDKASVVARIFWQTPDTSSSPSEFMDVQFSNFTASNGFTSKTFAFRMLRQADAQGNEVPQFRYDMVAGGPGLENLAPGSGGGFIVDPVAMTASVRGFPNASVIQRQAILGMYLNAQSILSAAKFTVTNPPPAGKPLWTSSELISLAAQAVPLIAKAVDPGNNQAVPLGDPYNCAVTTRGTDYPVCNDQAIKAFLQPA